MRALVFPVLLSSLTAFGQVEVQVFEGTVPLDGGTFFTVPFTVPRTVLGRSVQEIEIRHDAGSSSNVLDWGLLDERGGFRGWGGGNAEPAVVNARAASRGYRPGPLNAGRWEVLVGKARIADPSARYRIEVELRTMTTLPVQSRSTYSTSPPLSSTARWYAGDLHVHTLESGDARPSVDEVASFARQRGLDFVALSDHNTASQADFIGDAQLRFPELLLVPSMELTTSQGHLNAFGATTVVPFWLGRDGVTLQSALQQLAQQGVVATINHPTLDLGTFCIGCAWQQPVLPSLMQAIEVGVGGWDETGSLFDESAIAYWEALADRGVHLAAVGGSDDHLAGVGRSQTQSPIGSPTTLIYATELSVPALTRALREGRSMVKLRGPEDPFLALTPLTPLPRSQEVLVGDSVRVLATVRGGRGHSLAWVENGVDVEVLPIPTDDFLAERTLEAPAGRSARLRAEVRVGGLPRTLTSHLWLAPDSPPGPPITVARAGPRGCAGCTATDSGLWGLLALAAVWRRRR